MKTLAAILCLILASCADRVPPRAIILPETIVSAVDTAPVESSARAVSDGTERVIEANRKAREANNRAVDTSVQLRAAMERARILTEGQELLKQAWDEAERFAIQLGNELIATQSALADSQTETDGLREAVKSLASEVSTLKASAAVNKSATDSITAENKTLRAQAVQGNQAIDQLFTASANLKTEEAQNRKLWIAVIGLSIALIIALILLIYFAVKGLSPIRF